MSTAPALARPGFSRFGRSGYGRFLARRIALMITVLLIISVLVFCLAQALPGDLAHTILGPQATPQQYAAVTKSLGLDRPLLVRYVSWLGGIVRGDWGESLVTHQPVFPLLMDRVRASLELAGVALAMLVPLSVGAGVLSALWEGGAFDRITSVVGATLLVIPEFVSGVVLIVVFALGLGWFPFSAQAPPGAGPIGTIHHLILPALPITLVLFGYISRMARAGTLDVLATPYVRTAVLKGIRRRRVVLRHVLRNALPPTLYVVLLQAGFIMGGLVIVERLFSYPGLGKLLLDAANTHDVPVLEAAALATALLVMVMTLLADVLLALLDPRVRDRVTA